MAQTKFILKRSSLKKDTPKFWHRLGNALLAITPLIQGVIMQAPISDKAQAWGIFLTSCLTVAMKFLSYFFVEIDETKGPIDDIIN